MNHNHLSIHITVDGVPLPVSVWGDSFCSSSSSPSVWLGELRESDLDWQGLPPPSPAPTSVGCRKAVWTSWMWALRASYDSARKSQPSHCSTSIAEDSLENQGNLVKEKHKRREWVSKKLK